MACWPVASEELLMMNGMNWTLSPTRSTMT
jgi:hypothetical protein